MFEAFGGPRPLADLHFIYMIVEVNIRSCVLFTPSHNSLTMFSFIDGFPRYMFHVFASRGFLPQQAVPAADNKMKDLDAILKKYTSEVENHLRGATFLVVDKTGRYAQIIVVRYAD